MCGMKSPNQPDNPPTFSRSELEAYLELIFTFDEFMEVHQLFFSQLYRYTANDAQAIAQKLRPGWPGYTHPAWACFIIV